uniref:N-acetyltransferase domain-containing protein n=1 Tax=uncultured bacterium Ele16D6 TaxID=1340030 RepID=W5RBE5_9BACT|nr:hypothetical protein [uncultured bacterium Ele16D6]
MEKIRKATVEDIPMIRSMAEVVFMQTYATINPPEQMEFMMDWMYSEESLRRQMTTDGNVFLVVDGKAYASFRHEGMTEDGRDLFHLEKLYIMPEKQKTGLGKRMFDAVVEEIKKTAEGPVRIELNVNRHNPAVTFYEHIGMHKDRQGDFDIGHGYYMNDYIMAIDL